MAKIVIDQFDAGIQTSEREKIVNGAKMVKHFDIYSDPYKLSPMPSFERFNTTDEQNLGIVALGHRGDTIYGLGKAITSWFSSLYPYRILLTPDTSAAYGGTGAVPVSLIDLSTMPAHFWSNVNTSGSDIRFTGETGNHLAFDLAYFDHTAQEGKVWVRTSSQVPIYLYYGYADSVAPNVNSGIGKHETWENYHSVHNFEGDASCSTGDFRNHLTDGGTPTYGASLHGQGMIGHTGSSVRSDNSDNGGYFGGDDFTFHATFRHDGTCPAGNYFFWDNYGVVSMGVFVSINNDVFPYVFIDTDSGQGGFYQSTTPILPNQWATITFTYNDFPGSIYINGLLDSTHYSNSYNIDWYAPIPIAVNVPASGMILDSIWCRSIEETPATIERQSNVILNPGNVWVPSPEELFTNHTPVYDGVQIWEKESTGTAWVESEISGQPLKDINFHPVPAFVNYEGSTYQFIVSQNADNTGFFFLGNAGFSTTNIMNADEHLLDSRFAGSTLPFPTLSFAVDRNYYFNQYNNLDAFAGTTHAPDVYSAFPSITSHTPYDNFLAIGGTRVENGYVELYNLIDDDPVEVIDFGVGNLRNISNIRGTLVGAVDNYVQDSVRSRKDPSMDIRVWEGQNRVRTTHKISIDENLAPPTDSYWAVDYRRSYVRNAALFFAKPNTDFTGMFAIGKNEVTDRFGLSIMLDTSSLGDVQYHYSFANQLFFIHGGDNKISRLSDTGDYSVESVFESLVLDAGAPDKTKSWKGFEVTLDKPLPAGQIIKGFYKKDGDTTWTQVFTFDDTGEKIYEATNIMGTNAQLPDWEEVEIRVTSVGGDASITTIGLRIDVESADNI